MKKEPNPQEFAYATTAILSLIDSVGAPLRIKEVRAAKSLILSNTDLIFNYEYVFNLRGEFEDRLKEDPERATKQILSEIGFMRLSPDQAALAIDIGIKYLKKNLRITKEKIEILERAAKKLNVTFEKNLSFWIR
ncbi:hypothetical protein F3J37_00990 [Pantoea sp. Al-1710]|uniref:Uncharacterized protein n=1 Tax=Candidatus Pantoea communis TaxID=2608354 RepID=A0ABX0RI20_9GAMM|nr:MULTISPECIES: hypothetical protein [Pantoea]NIG13048.1 hypothetical protein [Pantoea sp. Cy-640]NIG17251.1 hypothetical protein [Pantoea communis]